MADFSATKKEIVATTDSLNNLNSSIQNATNQIIGPFRSASASAATAFTTAITPMTADVISFAGQLAA